MSPNEQRPTGEEPDAGLAIVNPGGVDAATLGAIQKARASAAVDKLFRTMQAEAARRGIRVDPIEDDRGRRVYIVSQWALSRQCDTLDELRAQLRRMGVPG